MGKIILLATWTIFGVQDYSYRPQPSMEVCQARAAFMEMYIARNHPELEDVVIKCIEETDEQMDS